MEAAWGMASHGSGRSRKMAWAMAGPMSNSPLPIVSCGCRGCGGSVWLVFISRVVGGGG